MLSFPDECCADVEAVLQKICGAIFGFFSGYRCTETSTGESMVVFQLMRPTFTVHCGDQ